MSVSGSEGASNSTSTNLAPIVCCVDDPFVRPLCVLMRSVVVADSAGASGLRIIVIHRGLTDASCREIYFHAKRVNLEVELRRAPVPSAKYPSFRWDSDVTYTRLAIAELLPDDPMALYIDVDTIVLRDLRPLLGRSLPGLPFAAVPDPTKPLLSLGRAIPGWESLGLPGSREYFNNGVMLLNIEECQKRNFFENASRFLIDHPQNVRYWDQDAMNWAATDDWVRLERRWNTFALSPLLRAGSYTHRAEPVLPLKRLLADEKTAAILHFAGPKKPWMQDYPKSPQQEMYSRFLAEIDQR